ncbi:MAG: B12-binding domain-containing radical SAM protein [Terriglobia bacterium]|nr:MAG: B12-binding domain-containing radical SAM protein [Terriglobia bacterium]
MVDVLLTHSNHLYHDRKQVRKMQPYPPLQTLLAAACLRREGYRVALFDSTFESPEYGFRRALEQYQPRLVAVCEDNFNFLTKMCLLRNRELAFEMARAAAGAGIPVVVNGSDASDHAAEYLGAGFAHVLIGEVEEAIVSVTRCLLETGFGPPPSRANPITDLDALPMPAWDLIDPEPYRRTWLLSHGYFSLNMASSRGCPFHCNWCAKPIWGSNYRCRAPRLVAAEMLELKTRFHPGQLWFADDIFALSPHWTHEFAAAVEAADAQIPFKMQSRCDLMTRDTVADLRRAGCVEVWMGVESGAQSVLDAMDKGTRVHHIYQARQNLRRYGIRACYFLQFGYPGETWTEIERTIALVRETSPDDIGVSVSYPLPGTPFYQMVASELGPKENWADSDDLEMMFQGAFTTHFYRALADALHIEVRHGAAAAGEAWSNVLALRETCVRKSPLWISC